MPAAICRRIAMIDMGGAILGVVLNEAINMRAVARVEIGLGIGEALPALCGRAKVAR